MVLNDSPRKEHSNINGDDEEGQVSSSTTTTLSQLIGRFGPWQLNISLFYFLSYTLTTFNNLGLAWHAPKTDYHCQSDQNSVLWATKQESCSSAVQCQQWAFNNSIGFERTIIEEVSISLFKDKLLNQTFIFFL